MLAERNCKDCGTRFTPRNANHDQCTGCWKAAQDPRKSALYWEERCKKALQEIARLESKLEYTTAERTTAIKQLAALHAAHNELKRDYIDVAEQLKRANVDTDAVPF